MTIGEIIRNRREELKMTQEELAALVGYKHKTSINKIEAGKQKIMQDKILIFANALQFTPEQLMGWDNPEPEVSVNLTDWESKRIDMYRSLDQRGRDVVNYILDEEYFRCQQLQEAAKYNDSLVPMLFAGYRAAAGRWIYDENMEVETILVKRKEGADFVIGVSGDSMEPDYNDGDMVYVKRTPQLDFGDVGLFQIGDEYYVKELGPDGLHSRNPKWPVIPKSEDIIVVGKVLGKVEKEKPWRPEKKR